MVHGIRTAVDFPYPRLNDAILRWSLRFPDNVYTKEFQESNDSARIG